MGEFYVGELGGVFIFAIAGVGLMLLAGYTGLISLGHAAFLGIGAYVNAVLLQQGVPFLITLPAAGLFTAICGAAIGRPTLRMSGLYLAIATLSFGGIVGTVFQKWTAVTGGSDGFAVPTPYVFGISVEGATGVYYTSLAVLIFVLWMSVNVLRSPMGRAMVAIRDSEVSAQSMGIHLAKYKTLAFALSAGITRTFSRVRCSRIMCGFWRRMRLTFCCRCSSLPLCLLVVLARCAARSWVRFLFGCCRAPSRSCGTICRLALGGCRDWNRRCSVWFWCLVISCQPGGHQWPVAEDEIMVPGLSIQTSDQRTAAENPCAFGAVAMTVLFEATDISVRFGGIRAVDSVSFDVEKGEIFSIIGPNGAGKTTIFNLISRIYNTTEGKLVFDGTDITRAPPHQIAGLGIARTFQNIELFANATLLQNLLIGRHCHSRSWLPVADRILTLDPAGRNSAPGEGRGSDQLPGSATLSGPAGSRISLFMACAKSSNLGGLYIEPNCLLLDEPSSGLNVEETEGMGFWIEDIKKDLGITVIMVEHDMALVSQVSDRVMALNYGKVLAMGTPHQVQTHPEVVRAYIGGDVEVEA